MEKIVPTKRHGTWLRLLTVTKILKVSHGPMPVIQTLIKYSFITHHSIAPPHIVCCILYFVFKLN